MKLIQIMLALHPGPDGKRIFKHPIHNGMAVYDAYAKTFQECSDKIDKMMERERFTSPHVVLQECEICSNHDDTYEQQIAEVTALLRVKYPNVTVTASDDVGHGRAFD